MAGNVIVKAGVLHPERQEMVSTGDGGWLSEIARLASSITLVDIKEIKITPTNLFISCSKSLKLNTGGVQGETISEVEYFWSHDAVKYFEICEPVCNF